MRSFVFSNLFFYLFFVLLFIGCEKEIDGPKEVVQKAIKAVSKGDYDELAEYATRDMVFLAQSVEAGIAIKSMNFNKVKIREIIDGNEAYVGFIYPDGETVKFELRNINDKWIIDVPKERISNDIDISDIFLYVENGDIILTTSSGIWSFYFRNISLKDKRFSHSGFLEKDGNEIYVISAGGNNGSQTYNDLDRIERVKLSDFIVDKERVGIFRAKTNKKKDFIPKSKEYLGMYFNYNFDLDDNESAYCTQFMERIFNETNSGIKLDRYYLEKYQRDVILVEELTKKEYFDEIIVINKKK
jgi:hypothetical protein